MNRFLIVRTSSLGDLVHGLPVASAIKKALPSAHVAWIVEKQFEALLKACPCVDEPIPVRLRGGPSRLLDASDLRHLISFLRRRARGKFDVAIDLQGLLRSGVLTLLSRAPVRIGFPGPFVRERANTFFTNLRPAAIPARSHVIDRNLALLHPLGIRLQGHRAFPLCLPAPLPRRPLPGAGNPKARIWVGLHPAAGWPTKQWGAERYAGLADRIAKRWNARVFVLWGPGERELAGTVLRSMRTPAELAPEMGVGLLAEFLARCDLVVGGDSGPLHLASALGTPVVGLYGPSDPVRNGPAGPGARIVRTGAPCAPCWKRSCPDRSCMVFIEVDRVWAEVEAAIEEKPRRAAPENQKHSEGVNNDGDRS